MLLRLVEHGDGGAGEFPERLLQDLRLPVPAPGPFLQIVKSFGNSVDGIELFAHVMPPMHSRC